MPIEDEGAEVMELTEQGFYEIRAQGRDADPAAVVMRADPPSTSPMAIAAGREAGRCSARSIAVGDQMWARFLVELLEGG